MRALTLPPVVAVTCSTGHRSETPIHRVTVLVDGPDVVAMRFPCQPCGSEVESTSARAHLRLLASSGSPVASVAAAL